jgi:hypothetical protein
MRFVLVELTCDSPVESSALHGLSAVEKFHFLCCKRSLIRIYHHETEKDNAMTVIPTIDSVMDSMRKFYIQLLDLIFRAAAILIKSLRKISLLDIKLKKRDGSYSSSSPDIHLLRLLRVSEMQIICGETPPRRDLHAPVLTYVEKLELGGIPAETMRMCC